MPRTVGVDFDGVIHAYSKGWHDGTIYDDLKPGALDGLRAMQRDYAVFVHTSRLDVAVAGWLVTQAAGTIQCVTEDPYGETVWQFHESGNAIGTAVHPPKFDQDHPRKFWDDQTKIFVTNRKLPAIAYIDDRGIRFTSWPQALADLAKHGGTR